MKKILVRIIVSVVAIVAVGVLAFFTVGPGKASSAKNKMGGGPGGFGGFGGGMQQQSTVSVKTMVAAVETLHDYVNTNGEISAQRTIDVLPEIGGKVTRVYVFLGSAVKKGQLIAQIDPSSPGEQYALSGVYAPISGTITSCSVREGATVSKSASLAKIGDVSNLVVTANIPERYVAALKPGLKANITLEAYGSEIFVATVKSVSPLVDSVSRTKEIELAFDKSDSRINPGMFAKLKLYTQDYSDEIVIPADSIVTISGKKYVYVVTENNTAERREITTGKTVDNYIQILSGVQVGEKVVIEGMRVLSNGSPVKEVGMNNESSGKGENKKASGGETDFSGMLPDGKGADGKRSDENKSGKPGKN